jgi:hypothetical protein
MLIDHDYLPLLPAGCVFVLPGSSQANGGTG